MRTAGRSARGRSVAVGTRIRSYNARISCAPARRWNTWEDQALAVLRNEVGNITGGPCPALPASRHAPLPRPGGRAGSESWSGRASGAEHSGLAGAGVDLSHLESPPLAPARSALRRCLVVGPARGLRLTGVAGVAAPPPLILKALVAAGMVVGVAGIGWFVTTGSPRALQTDKTPVAVGGLWSW